MVVCSSRLVVAMIRCPSSGFFDRVFCFASFQQQLVAWSFLLRPHDHYHPAYVFTDIASYQGKLFALSCCEELFFLDVGGEMDHHQQHHPIVDHVNEPPPATWLTNCYLVISSDENNLLMVRWRRRITIDGHPAMDLWVFEADFVHGRWLELTDLGNQVLFIGRNCSMAFPASSTEHWGQRFRGGNRVFVPGTEWARSSGRPISHKKEIPSYCVYNMASGETSFVSLDGPHYMESFASGWFFFPNA
jgi:hypothetical protein